MNLEDYIDQPVKLMGLAERAKAGAILQCGPNSVVYIEGLAQWNDEDLYSAFQVSGTLTAEGSDADLRDADGEVTHGIGRHYVVKDATWERIS